MFEENKREFKDTLEQMKGQTLAQQGATGVARESLVSVQRAFMSFIGGMKIKKEISDNKITGLTVTCPFQNLGQTSTVQAKGRVNWKAFPMTGMPSDFDFADQDARVRIQQFYVPRGADANATMTIPIPQLQLLKLKTQRMYVWGWFAYNDVFTGTPRHLTEFCSEVVDFKTTKDDLTDPLTDFTWEISLCESRNCYDRECFDYASKIKK